MMGPQMRVCFIYEGAEVSHYTLTQNTITEETKTWLQHSCFACVYMSTIFQITVNKMKVYFNSEINGMKNFLYIFLDTIRLKTLKTRFLLSIAKMCILLSAMVLFQQVNARDHYSHLMLTVVSEIHR